VWFNIGVKRRAAAGSACFILAVDDTMDAILNWYREEGVIFKGGSGSGINLSRIRSSKEQLKGGGTRRARSASCAAPTRRPARSSRAARRGAPRRWSSSTSTTPTSRVHLVQGARGAQGARPARRRLRHGPRRQDSHSIQYQNANNSVRVTDEFMQAVVDDATGT
jgi:ribonucleoside-diphosphate reductase alpha chain